jgi:hypothetical protein
MLDAGCYIIQENEKLSEVPKGQNITARDEIPGD